MESSRDKFVDQAIALLRVALTTLKSAHPAVTISVSIQFSELHSAAREVMDECSRLERDAFSAFAAQKQALEQTIAFQKQHIEKFRAVELTVASQKQQIEKFRTDLDDQRECCKLLKVDLSSQKAECDQLVADAKNSLQKHIGNSGKRIALMVEEKQQIEEHTQALHMQVSQLEKQVEEERLRLNASGEQVAHLRKQLTDEKEKLICIVCLDKPRDTLIMPCLHFHYCFSCLMQHKQTNGSTCPTCRGTIHGLCMSSFLT
ncbi:hypothetical protein L7F22_067078 [Adiantum nelumboides]|nr:hypothetical protein [Adiantum nelumboides]